MAIIQAGAKLSIFVPRLQVSPIPSSNRIVDVKLSGNSAQRRKLRRMMDAEGFSTLHMRGEWRPLTNTAGPARSVLPAG